MHLVSKKKFNVAFCRVGILTWFLWPSGWCGMTIEVISATWIWFRSICFLTSFRRKRRFWGRHAAVSITNALTRVSYEYVPECTRTCSSNSPGIRCWSVVWLVQTPFKWNFVCTRKCLQHYCMWIVQSMIMWFSVGSFLSVSFTFYCEIFVPYLLSLEVWAWPMSLVCFSFLYFQ